MKKYAIPSALIHKIKFKLKNIIKDLLSFDLKYNHK